MSSRIFFAGEENTLAEFLHDQAYSHIMLLADACTNGCCVPRAKALLPVLNLSSLTVIPKGEENKNLAACELIWDSLLQQTAGRRTLLVNIGGGMLSDVGGFAASVYKRGIDFINFPTTLLAMVDAAYGGKTGIDFRGIKNNIGSFQHPLALYIHPGFLQTLDQRVLISGIAETVKHALISSSSWWDEIQKYTLDEFSSLQSIRRSLMTKMGYCDQDPYDKGVRQSLNFGHSIGHAIESASLTGAQPLLHGEAVMLGMYYELLLSTRLLQLPPIHAERIVALISSFFPKLNTAIAFDQIIEFLWQDKKNEGGLCMSLLKEPGDCVTGVMVNETDLRNVMKR